MSSNIGKKLKQLRKDKSLTIEDLAKELAVSVGIISEWERGKKEPRPATRKKICTLYNISESELFESITIQASASMISGLDKNCCEDSIAFAKVRTPTPRPITFNNCKQTTVKDDAMAPAVHTGQTIIYTLKGKPKDNDIVFVILKNGTELCRQYSISPDGETIILRTINPSFGEPPRIIDKDEIQACFKVVGVKY